jgi:hypothetical protein
MRTLLDWVGNKSSSPMATTVPPVSCPDFGNTKLAFTLVVDDFSVKYTKKEDADHLLTTLEKMCVCSND